jgi:CHASE1-domain containing sensor protein
VAVARVERENKMSDRDPSDHRQGDIIGIERRRIPASRPRLYRAALVAAGIGLLLSLAAAYAVGQWEARVTKVEFEGVAETQAIVMQNGMNEYVSRLAALRTLFESANEEITRSEFETFSGRLFEQHPGILRVAWLPRINRKERAEYEAAAIADGISGYHIKSLAADGSLATAAQSDEYFPVFYSTESKTSVVYGMDYSSAPVRRDALERARDNDLVTALRTRLYETNGGIQSQGVLVCVPVYAKGTSRATIADRRRNLSGYVVGIFDLPQLLQWIRTTTAASAAVSVRVYPPESGTGATPQELSAPDFTSEHQTLRSMRAFAIGPHWTGALKIGDRQLASAGRSCRRSPACHAS